MADMNRLDEQARSPLQERSQLFERNCHAPARTLLGNFPENQRTLPRYFLDLFRDFPGHASGKFPHCSCNVLDISRTCPEHLSDISRKLPGQVSEYFSDLLRTFLGTSQTCPGPFPNIYRTCPRHFQNMLPDMSEYLSNISQTIPGHVSGYIPDICRDTSRHFLELVFGN